MIAGLLTLENLLTQAYQERWTTPSLTSDGTLTDTGTVWANVLNYFNPEIAVEVFNFWMYHGTGYPPGLDNIAQSLMQINRR